MQYGIKKEFDKNILEPLPSLLKKRDSFSVRIGENEKIFIDEKIYIENNKEIFLKKFFPNITDSSKYIVIVPEKLFTSKMNQFRWIKPDKYAPSIFAVKI